ncbi:MAG: amidohydrolase family protein [Gemmatimonadaceae bacterium]
MTSPPVPSGTVAVQGREIVYVGPRESAPPGNDVDLGDSILLPGLVNAHTHLELTAFRGLLEEMPFEQWVFRLQAAKIGVMTEADYVDSVRLGILEGLYSGVTTFGDTCDSGVSLSVMGEFRVRGVMYQEVFGPSPEQCAGSLAVLKRKITALRQQSAHSNDDSSLLTLGVSPHAPYTVSDQLFAAVARFAIEESLPLAVHIAESEAELQYVRCGDGPFAEALRARGIHVASRARSPIALLNDTGVLGCRPLLIHAVRADAEDVEIMSKTQCAVAHCPVSNAKLGHGTAPITEFLAAGIPVGLGSDSMASNNCMNLLDEARIAFLMQRTRSNAAAGLSAADLIELVTLGGARALGLSDTIGSLEPGKEADLVAFSLEGASGSPFYAPETALVFALACKMAKFVTVAGELRVWESRALVDEIGIANRVAKTARKLYNFVNR